MIDFENLLSGTDTDDARDANTPVVVGLIVSERPRTGEFLQVEEAAFLAVGKIPDVLFLEDDPETGASVFAPQSARQFADAMQMTRLPTEAEASAWHAARAGAVYDLWRDRLQAAWAKDQEQ
jgi:hypothetical protein